MHRYLLFMSYTGTRLRGVIKQRDEISSGVPKSVQAYLDEGLKRLCLSNTPETIFSSRTDSGTHAFCNTAHVDLCKETKEFYEPFHIAKVLNAHFKRQGVDIRINNVLTVPSRFHARHCASGRSYLYRLAILRPEALDDVGVCLPAIEAGKAFVVKSPFDVASVVSASQLFQGTHNFGTFRKTSRPPPDPVRTLESVTISKGRPWFDPIYVPMYEKVDFLDIIISSKGFLRQQVRRIVGTLVSVGRGNISLDRVQCMLDDPSPGDFSRYATTAPAGGLYLLKVKYPPEVFEESFYERECDGEKDGDLNQDS